MSKKFWTRPGVGARVNGGSGGILLASLLVCAGCGDVVGAHFDDAHPFSESDAARSGGAGDSSSGGRKGAGGGANNAAAGSSGAGRGSGGDFHGDTGGGGRDAGSADSSGVSAGGDENGGGSGAGSGGADGGACTRVAWCLDTDTDGFGDPSTKRTQCDEPGSGWVKECSDCADDNPDVHPGAACADTGYALATGGTSFDYDCDGHEDECGTIVKAAATCTSAGPLKCAGSGYLKNPDRAASASQNPYCGSTAWQTCTAVGVPCVLTKETKAAVPCQ